MNDEQSNSELNPEAIANLAGFFDALIQMDLAQSEPIYQKLHKQEGISNDSH